MKNKTDKLSRLIIEHGSYEKKTLSVGETWDIGGGWRLTVQSIYAHVPPRQAWLVLSKDGVKKEDVILAQGQIFTHIENIANETDVPLFMTYLDSVFAGSIYDMVQLRYTWAIDTKVTELRVGDRFGVLNVTTVAPSTIQLRNTGNPVPLSRDSIVDIMGNMKFKVADSDILRFYPKVDYEILLPPTLPCYNSTLNGYDFRDTNVNGKQDFGEPGLANWTIRLRGRDSCTNTAVNRITKTNAKGYYEFTNVSTGTYLLSEKLPAGWLPTTPGVYNLSLPPYTTVIKKDFGNTYDLVTGGLRE